MEFRIFLGGKEHNIFYCLQTPVISLTKAGTEMTEQILTFCARDVSNM